MIDERLEEQAALYVLGALSEAETREFKQLMERDVELKELVASLTKVVGALVWAVPIVEPPSQLKVKILARIGPTQEIIASPERKFLMAIWLRRAMAACLVILCLVLLAQDGRLRKTIGLQASQIHQLNQLAKSLQSDTNNLEQTVRRLQETNRLASLRIAMLNSLVANAPKTAAVSLWDEARQEGVLVGENFKPLPADKDYQLWVLDNGRTPVDAGVFYVDEGGRVRAEFKTKHPIQIAGRFAVTEEIKGGVPSPTIKNMVLASN